jgi:hypothetical protein
MVTIMHRSDAASSLSFASYQQAQVKAHKALRSLDDRQIAFVAFSRLLLLSFHAYELV